MRHDWVFEVLKDLQEYAARNGLPALAAKAEAALAVAEAEIAAQGDTLRSGDPGARQTRPH